MILGEFDALPGLSQKDSPVQAAIAPGAPGHGCGHNLLGSASALAAVSIKEEMETRGLKGTIRYYGTPAEEGGGGKIYMIHVGLFRDVDAVLAWHPGDSNAVNLKSMLAVNYGKFRFYGMASHAAAGPERGRSALDGAMIMLTAVEFLREHVPQETRIHYIISNGGAVPNVVPTFAEVSLGARYPDAQVLEGIWNCVMKCAQAGALASETRMEFIQGSTWRMSCRTTRWLMFWAALCARLVVTTTLRKSACSRPSCRRRSTLLSIHPARTACRWTNPKAAAWPPPISAT